MNLQIRQNENVQKSLTTTSPATDAASLQEETHTAEAPRNPNAKRNIGWQTSDPPRSARRREPRCAPGQGPHQTLIFPTSDTSTFHQDVTPVREFIYYEHRDLFWYYIYKLVFQSLTYITKL